MKTHLIVLEPHDDLVSVRDRMSWAKTPRILLIWPVGEKISLRPVDLKILQRHAHALGATLGLVTRDRRVQREAAALGMPLFKSNSAAQRDAWPVTPLPTFRERGRVDLRRMQAEAHPPEARWKTTLAARILFFALGVLAVLALAALFVPSGKITFSPETKTSEATIPIVADPALTSVYITGGIPAHETTVEISGSQDTFATGKAAVPESEAKGVARFSNLTASAVDIPRGTIVQTSGASPIRFATTQDAQAPAGIGKTVDVPIQSVNAGTAGNLDTDSIQAIDGLLGSRVAVTNPAPTTGGSDRQVAAPSADDRERLHNSLMEKLLAQAQTEMSNGLPSGSVIFSDTIQAAEIIEENYDPEAGGNGATLTLTLRVKFSGQYASGLDLTNLATLSMSAAPEAGFSALPASLTLQPLDAPATSQTGRTSFRLRATWTLVSVVDSRQALALVQGRRVEDAEAELQKAFPLDKPRVAVSPSWWPWLPLAPFRIQVTAQ